MKKISDPGSIVNRALYGDDKLIVWVRPTDILKLEEAGTHKITEYASHGFYAFAYNNEHTILKDKKVRQAFTYATDRQQLLESWFDGRGKVLAGPFSPSTPYYDPLLKPLSFSPEKARALLDEAGYLDRDGDGVKLHPGQLCRECGL